MTRLPGPTSLPVLGQTIPFLRDPYGTYFRNRDRFGDVFRLSIFGQDWVVLAGPDALDRVLTNRDGIFSAREGLRAFAPFFSGGLLHRDGTDHRTHRRALQGAFRAEAMRGYLDLMNDRLPVLLAELPADTRLSFLPRARDLTLRIAAHVFMGLTDRATIDRVNALFLAEVAGTAALIRNPWPFTRMGRAVAARATLSTIFRDLIPARRAHGGADLFSQLCTARDEDGAALSDDEIVDHFNFFLAAAHDAVTGALTVMTWAMARDPSLQDALKAEVESLPGGPLAWDDLSRLNLVDRTHREALRRLAPSGFTARRATESFDWQGHLIPAGTDVAICPGPIMMDPALWPDPDRFDPGRFAPPREEHLTHRFAWAPYGGGVHKCIGLHFAVLQLKAIMTHFLRTWRVEMAPQDDPTWTLLPTPTPSGGLLVTLRSSPARCD